MRKICPWDTKYFSNCSAFRSHLHIYRGIYSGQPAKFPLTPLKVSNSSLFLRTFSRSFHKGMTIFFYVNGKGKGGKGKGKEGKGMEKGEKRRKNGERERKLFSHFSGVYKIQVHHFPPPQSYIFPPPCFFPIFPFFHCVRGLNPSNQGFGSIQF